MGAKDSRDYVAPVSALVVAAEYSYKKFYCLRDANKFLEYVMETKVSLLYV